jgi:tetratricopeptide (TPR) repeat protein
MRLPENVRMILVMGMLSSLAMAQAGGGGTGGGGGGGGRPGGSTGGGGTRTTTTTNTTRPSSRDTVERRPIFLSGNVVVADGSPLPERAVIERICGANTRREATTDTKGYFTFQLGNRSMSMFQDASVGGGGDYSMARADGMSGPSTSDMPGLSNSGDGVSRYELAGCELRAAVPGFRSSSVRLENVQYLSQNNVGTIVLARMGTVQGNTVSVSLLQAPKDAKKAYEKGHEALKKGKIEDARKHLQKSLEIYPKMAPAHYDLGFADQSEKKAEDARKHYSQAMEIDPVYVQPILQMASLAASEANWAETARWSEKAMQLDQIDFPVAFFYNAVANLNMGKLDLAEKSARKALQLDGGHSITRLPMLMAKILETKHDYAGAAEQIRTYLKISPDAADAAAARENLAAIEKSGGLKASQ